MIRILKELNMKKFALVNVFGILLLLFGVVSSAAFLKSTRSFQLSGDNSKVTLMAHIVALRERHINQPENTPNVEEIFSQTTSKLKLIAAQMRLARAQNLSNKVWMRLFDELEDSYNSRVSAFDVEFRDKQITPIEIDAFQLWYRELKLDLIYGEKA
jgi:hypothetical protein